MICSITKYINGNTIVKRSDFSIKRRLLKIDETPRYEFPDTIEIKITDRCMYECKLCPENSKSNGINNIQKDKLFQKLSELPKLPLIFILSGGNLLENLKETVEVITYLKKEFKDCLIISNLNSLDTNRIDNLTHCSFGRGIINSFIDNTNFFSISLGQYYDKVLLKNSFFNSSGLNRLSLNNNLIFRLTNGSPIESIIKDSENLYTKNYFIISKEVINKNKDLVLDVLNKMKLSYTDHLNLYIDDNVDNLKIDNKYILGWDNYVFIDSVNGKFSVDRKNKISWENLKLLEFYDTYNKQRILSEK